MFYWTFCESEKLFVRCRGNCLSDWFTSGSAREQVVRQLLLDRVVRAPNLMKTGRPGLRRKTGLMAFSELPRRDFSPFKPGSGELFHRRDVGGSKRPIGASKCPIAISLPISTQIRHMRARWKRLSKAVKNILASSTFGQTGQRLR